MRWSIDPSAGSISWTVPLSETTTAPPTTVTPGLCRYLGHSMKGCGGGYGFNALSELGEILEQGAQNRNSEAITNAVNDLQAYLEQVEIIYD